ncbi:MAG TPA: anthranilate synthase component I, partial [Thermoanaerobaculia bacterium]|nr:anthranilate synthase component I [Thermoanaerobaculia bacterium]
MTGREKERGNFRSRARDGSSLPVARVFPSDAFTPVMVMRRLRASGEECFLLESVAGGESVARYTFLGCGPVARLTVEANGIFEERDGEKRPVLGEPLHALERLTVEAGFDADPELPPLTAGAVGYLAYDAVRFFEEIPDRHPREGSMPEGLFLLFDAVVAFDHARQRLLLLTNLHGETDVEPAMERLDRLERLVFGADLPLTPALSRGERGQAGDAREEFATGMPRERYLEIVARAKEAILAGEVYQVVLSQRWRGPLDVDPFDAYRALRMLNPSPYMFYLETREATIFGASPEMLVRCRGDIAETRPIAGTTPRGADRAADEMLATALLADPKERAEHVMLVDLGRNDLGRVCAIGSVEVPRYAVIEKYSHVQHIVSEVRGTLAPGESSADALAACFPAGTLTGAPKIRAMELIDELEASRRGLYGGVVGYLDAAGNLDVAIAIRTAVVEKGLCTIQAGAGIVADSIAEREYRECEAKAAALFRAIDLAREWTQEPLSVSPSAQRPAPSA